MAELPTEVADEAERLTRLARTATDPDERAARRERRDDRLAEHGFTARVREDPDGDVLVCYPSEWIVDGEVRTDRIEDTDRAVERRLSGTEPGGDWEALATHNNRVAERVADAHGPVHGANARVFADFMSNHRARRVGTATEADRTEFRTEYFVRNAWPTDDQRAAVETSLSLVADVATALEKDE
ncbi:rnhA operon protein [Halococcus sp. IIIV-5B]|uniref:DUF7108 family protein n=1 Tax=Halococcus sp. IIIV-5B TaxID=2321230 RepID=UPI000E75BC03|nr:rnhA operon protein [Halococcus sp. IIIV-5B]RJT06113.1 rnhA operon protein [Halococcus sp. IIIV-5B]